ncbi:MAG: hypothetical protein ABJC12_12980 [Saprospiraceae bacterium]
MRLHKQSIFLWAGLLFCLSLNGQSTLSVGSILSSAKYDLSVDLQQKHIEFISGINENIPFPDQVSFRTETDRFLAYRQEYLLRLSVNGLNEMSQQRKLNDASRLTEQQVLHQYEHEAIKKRYDAINDYKFLLLRFAIQQELSLVLDDKVNVLNKMASLSTGVEIDELIKTEYDRDELHLDIEDAKTQLGAIRKKIELWMPDAASEWNLDTLGFIQTTQVQLVVDQIPQVANLNPWVLEKQLKLEEAQAKYNVEKANSKKMLDFFQVRYSSRPNEILFREFSAGMGINLPFKGSSRVKLAEMQIDKNTIEQNIKLNLDELNGSILLAHTEMNALIDRYHLAEEQWKESQNRFTLEHPSSLQPEGPMTLLKARELQIKRKLNLLDVQKQIMAHYISILDLTGALSSVPSINYLSAGLEVY